MCHFLLYTSSIITFKNWLQLTIVFIVDYFFSSNWLVYKMWTSGQNKKVEDIILGFWVTDEHFLTKDILTSTHKYKIQFAS